MNANELRIGNYYNSHGTFKKATPSTIEELFESENRTWIQPIPITEEILLKCGFKKKNGYGFKLGNIRVSKVDCLTRDEYAFSYYDLWINLRSLHQLQNLYFSLTTKELEINL